MCCYLCCCAKKKKEKPLEMDQGYYPGVEMDEAMFTQGYPEGYNYGQEGYFEENEEYEQDEYDYDHEFWVHLDKHFHWLKTDVFLSKSLY